MAVHKRKRMKQALVVPEIPQWYRDETITLETLMELTLPTAITGSVTCLRQSSRTFAVADRRFVSMA